MLGKRGIAKKYATYETYETFYPTNSVNVCVLDTCRVLNIFYGRFFPKNFDIVNILLTFATETRKIASRI